MASPTRAKPRTLPCKKMSHSLLLSMSTVSNLRNLFSGRQSVFMLGWLLCWKVRCNSSVLVVSGLPDFMHIAKESCRGCRSGVFDGNFVVNDFYSLAWSSNLKNVGEQFLSGVKASPQQARDIQEVWKYHEIKVRYLWNPSKNLAKWKCKRSVISGLPFPLAWSGELGFSRRSIYKQPEACEC